MHSWHTRKGTVFVTSGVGYGKTSLSAFDAAELDAKIHATNAIRVTSFVPPHWSISKQQDRLATMSGKGAFLPMAYQYAISVKESVAACLVIGINADLEQASIIMEHAETGMEPEALQQIAQESVCEVFRFRGWTIADFVKSEAFGKPKDGLFVCALVAALYFPGEN